MIGRSINNYEIKAPIGEGGMGTVYLAEHPFMGRKAAIKLLRKAYLDDEKMVARFMNEARAANAIRHPNIIDIIDVGRLPEPDGVPYLMMEHLQGETLAQRLRRLRPLPVREALDVVAQAAGALAAAHDVGIVHRDLKPQNLFLVVDATAFRGERVKVLDFGIAKLLADVSGDRTDGTTGAALLGSPLYMSPEQCRGLTAEIDHRTDIYALAALTYEMLCGAPPFVSEASGDILMMHVSQAPAPLRALNPDVPEHVEAAILRALAKRPDDRFESMTAFQLALERAPVLPVNPPRAVEIPPRLSHTMGATPPLVAVNTPAPVLAARSRRTRRVVMATVAALAVGTFYLVDRDRIAPRPAVVGAPVPAAGAPAVPAPVEAPLVNPEPEPIPPAAPPATAAQLEQPVVAGRVPLATGTAAELAAVGERGSPARGRPVPADGVGPRHRRKPGGHRTASSSRGRAVTRSPAREAAPPEVIERPSGPADDRARWIEKW